MPKASSRAEPEIPRRKNMRLHQSKIDRAMKLLGTRTETETIERALDLVAFREAVLGGFDGMFGSGLANVMDDE